MTTTLKEIEDEMMKKFDERFDCIFYDPYNENLSDTEREMFKSFLSSFALKVAEATRDAMVVEAKEENDRTLEIMPEKYWRHRGLNDARKESLNRWNIFIGNNDK